MIDILSSITHWCVSCVNDGNVIPGVAGIFGGTAGALGGLGALTPMSDLWPPGTTTNPDGSLTWPNEDGTTSTRHADGTVTTTSASGPTTTTYPGGGGQKETVGTDGTRTVTDHDGHTISWGPGDVQTDTGPDGTSTSTPFSGQDGDDEKIVGPHDPNPMEDRNGNALPGLAVGAGGAVKAGLESGMAGIVHEVTVEGASHVAEMGGEAAYDRATEGSGGEESAGGGESSNEPADAGAAHPGEDDPPDATVPDATVGNTYPPDPGGT